MNFKWHPRDFHDVVRDVTSGQGVMLQAMTQAIRMMGSLSCPAPSWDPSSTYRVGLDNGKLVIQKFGTDHVWHAADLTAPASDDDHDEWLAVEEQRPGLLKAHAPASAATLTAEWHDTGNSLTVEIKATGGQYETAGPFQINVLGEWELQELAALFSKLAKILKPS